MKNYQVLQEALDKATQRGVFSLQEVGYVMASLKAVYSDLSELEARRDTPKTHLVEPQSVVIPTPKQKKQPIEDLDQVL